MWRPGCAGFFRSAITSGPSEKTCPPIIGAMLHVCSEKNGFRPRGGRRKSLRSQG